MIHPTAEIPDHAILGDECDIGPGVRITAEHFECGDYVKLHQGTWIRGKSVTIGHCGWIGQGCILDGEGGLTIEDFVGIGAGSQVWTHAAQGDRLQGCVLGAGGPFPLVIREDAWLVGHVLVGGAREIAARSVVLMGSVVTRDVVWHTDQFGGNAPAVWGGNPLRPIRSDYPPGPWWAWEPRTEEDIRLDFHVLKTRYVEETGGILPARIASYDPIAREYEKTGDPREVAFNRWLFHGRAYFRPRRN